MAQWVIVRGCTIFNRSFRSSLTSQVYSLIHVAQIWRSDHSGARKLALMVESIYNGLNLIFTWFALANFYIFFVSVGMSVERLIPILGYLD